jgi:hypothetical protein
MFLCEQANQVQRYQASKATNDQASKRLCKQKKNQHPRGKIKKAREQSKK